jgi:hypothetical protein
LIILSNAISLCNVMSFITSLKMSYEDILEAGFIN